MNHYSTVEEFIAKIVDDVYEVCPHHFIAKVQANHLKMAKENLSKNELIILLDFAENYSFVVQDAVQGFHWEKGKFTSNTTPICCIFQIFQWGLETRKYLCYI